MSSVFHAGKNGLMEFYSVWRTVFKWNKVHLTILALATEEFKKSRKMKMQCFQKCTKNLP